MAPCRQLIRSEEYKNGTWPISTPLFDNIDYGRFAVEILKTLATVCQTHLTGIAANNGTQRKHFKERKHYEKFYDYVCRIMRLEDLGIHLWFATTAPACPELRKMEPKARKRLQTGLRNTGVVLSRDAGSLAT